MRPTTWTVAAAVALLLLPALAGCSGGEAGASRDVAAADAGPESAADAAPTDRAADFTLKELGGDSWSLAEEDGRVRLIDFWATWCAPCREEVPMLNELHETYEPLGLTIVAIADADDAPELVQEFVDELDVRYLTLLGKRDVQAEYQIFGLPTAFLVDREGRVVETYFGPKPRKALERRIRELLDLPEDA